MSFFLILMPFFMVHSKTYQKVSVDKLNASSSLNQANSGEFFPHNILNENSNPWIEGKSSDGIGEYVDMHFTTSFRFNRISIINGFNDKIKFKKYN
ncbi:MAG: hypothetical protein GY714_13165 [Desulfobacterales bacterium]|nr:hypothetical protein [Desulfobacterales bacterium]